VDAEADIAAVAALIANPARASMLDSLFDGEAHSAGSLAARGGISPSTASAHIDALVAGGLIVEERRGRQRLLRLAGPDVAQALEALSLVAPTTKPRPLRGPDRIANLRAGRTCYDHLAGALGVELTDALVARGGLELAGPDYALTATGEQQLRALGVDVDRARGARRAFARACLDWSERRPHLAGALGAALADRLFELGWLVRLPAARSVKLTSVGDRELSKRLGLRASTPTSDAIW
jgi:DNA-binding transcriptional ArsR family regulator